MVGQQASSRRAGKTRSDHHDGMVGGGGRLVGEGPVAVHVKPAHVGARVALANQTKNRSRWVEGSVKQAVAPLHTDHRGRVATVQGVLVVEMLAPSHGLLEVCRPKRERFAPRHADVVVQLAVAQERALAGRPQGVVDIASFELPQRVLGGARVIGGGTPREAGPFGKVVNTIGLIRGKNVVPRVFSEDEQFVEVLVGGFGSDLSGFSGDAHRGNHPVVDVG